MTKAPNIHPNAINLMVKVFSSHKKGLPEWLKNAREGMLRNGVPSEDRHVIINYASKGRRPYLECIDFGGISGSDIETRYFHWANPDVARVGLKHGEQEGGQGNGGKGYLRQMFEKGYFISIYNGLLSVASFTDPEKFVLGFVPDDRRGKDATGDNPELKGIRKEAEQWLESYGLPRDHNITIVRGYLPKKPIEPEKLLEEIQQYPHARETIKACKVHFLVDHVLKRELKVIEPSLHSMFPQKIRLPIPEKITLPDGTIVKTTKPPGFAAGELELGIAAQPLVGQKLETWNRIDFHAGGVTVVGFAQANVLPLKFPQFASYIFGSCNLPLLKDPADDYEMQGRGELNEGALRSALYQFVAQAADKCLEQLAKQLAGARDNKKRENLERLHERLTDWIAAKLSALRGWSDAGDTDGDALGGDGVGGGKRKRKTPKRQKHEPPVKLVIHREKLNIAKDATYQLRAVGYDKDDRPVPAGKLVWTSAKPSVASIDPERGILIARSEGIATISVRNDLNLTCKTPTLVQVHVVEELSIKNPSPVKVGSNRRVPLSLRVKLQSGKSAPADLVVMWKSGDDRVATVGQDGNLVGGEVGETDVTAFAGNVESDPTDVVVERGSAGKPRGGGKGRPQILLSGQNPCPFTNVDFLLNPNDPPVYQRPWERDYAYNIFWINLQHPLAAELLKNGEASLQWRTYHFQRIVDVFTIIEMRRTFGETENLDVDRVLDEIQTVAAALYKDVRDDALFALLYDEKVDLAGAA
jgi:Bacterial Ig-like domain (group 2)